MKVSISNLEEFGEKHRQAPPFFTNREFNVMMTAVRAYTGKLRFPTMDETPRQKRQRQINRAALESAINKLRTLTRD